MAVNRLPNLAPLRPHVQVRQKRLPAKVESDAGDARGGRRGGGGGGQLPAWPGLACSGYLPLESYD